MALLENNRVDINIKLGMFNPLHVAIYKGYFDIAKCLFEYGANLDLDSDLDLNLDLNLNLLKKIIEDYSFDNINWLITSYPQLLMDMNMIKKKELVHIALKGGSLSVVKLLLQHGEKLDELIEIKDLLKESIKNNYPKESIKLLATCFPP